MDLRDFLYNPAPPAWSGTHRIPWHEPDFSARMLREHLDQSHDRASRPTEFIDAQVVWLQRELLGDSAALIDLGCGPGLYCARLAALGYRCTGVDIGPASIAYAQQHRDPATDCQFLLADFRSLDLGQTFDAALLLFGELGAFPPADAQRILRGVVAHLKPGGHLVLELNDHDATERLGHEAPSWQRAERSVFADEPHIFLREPSWDSQARAAIERYLVLAEDQPPRLYTTTLQAYAADHLGRMLYDAGFRDVSDDCTMPTQPGLSVIVATR